MVEARHDLIEKTMGDNTDLAAQIEKQTVAPHLNAAIVKAKREADEQKAALLKKKEEEDDDDNNDGDKFNWKALKKDTEYSWIDPNDKEAVAGKLTIKDIHTVDKKGEELESIDFDSGNSANSNWTWADNEEKIKGIQIPKASA